jgi:hypothetical protein
MNNDNNICGAKTKSTGQPCQRRPAEGRERCYLHGGNQPRGKDHHNWKRGMYSAYAGESLKKVLDELEGMPDEELTRVSNEIKLLQALIMKSRAIEQGTGDLNDLDVISKVIERLIKSKQRAVSLRIEEKRLVPIEDMQQFLQWMQQLLFQKVEKDKANEILTELENFKITES